MVVLSKLSFRILLQVGAVLMVAVILTCYGLAVSEGHVPAWLPTISSCGDYPPEKFVFTYGVIVVAALLFVESLCLYGADKPYSHSLLILVVSAVAAFFLGVVGSVCSKCDSAVHDFSAVTFFILEDVYMALILTYSLGRMGRASIALKTTCAVVCTVSTALRLMIQSGQWHSLEELDFPLLAIVEWINTAFLIGFHWSFGLDFPGYFLAEVKESTQQLPLALEGVKKKNPQV